MYGVSIDIFLALFMKILFFFKTLYNAVLICEMCESAGKASEFLEQLASFDNTKLYEVT